MGAIKDYNYTPEELLMYQFGRALGHPARSKMINLLKKKKSFRNTDMCKVLEMKVSTIHDHIRILKEADLVYLEYANHEYHITLNEENYRFYVNQLN